MTTTARPRIEDAFSGKGGLFASGRWHSRGCLVVYASESAALAYLETLAHFASEESVVELLQFEIEIPDAMIGTLTDLPKNWHARPPSPATQELGDGWLRNKTSVALKVPSVIVPRESNILINPLHPNFKLGWAKGPKPFPHDPRLTRKK